jgi:2-polyprenyl-6-methoxyphenol hydroxylase-like FAD-dependent oxidoreductase
MSPVGGVGINLAIQDAVATANLLAGPLRADRVGLDDLERVQRRRQWPTRFTQRLQVFVQDRILGRVLADDGPRLRLPLPLRLLRRFPFLRRIPARLVGLGVRPEHVKY